MSVVGKLGLLRSLDSVIADVREATAAIQRDDYKAAAAKFEAASSGVKAAAEELRAA